MLNTQEIDEIHTTKLVKANVGAKLGALKRGMKICHTDYQSRMYKQNNLQPYSDTQPFLFIWVLSLFLANVTISQVPSRNSNMPGTFPKH